jgi:plasmid stability protein
MMTIRNLDPETDHALREKARKEHKSINTVVLETLRDGLLPKRKHMHHDLDHLAGTWTTEEATAFELSIEPLRKTDTDLWK